MDEDIEGVTLFPLSSSSPIGKSLKVRQYANISKTYQDIVFPMNLNFDLAPYWTSKNVSINYNGVAKKKDWVSNGEFDSDLSSWTYKTNNPTGFTLGGYSGSTGNPAGSAKFRMTGSRSEGDYAYFEQNITISDKFAAGEVRFYMDYYLVWTSEFNGSIYMALIVDNVEKNKTIHLTAAPKISWDSMILNYDPIAFGQELPETITLRVGVYTWEDDSISPWNDIFFDNIKCEIWTKSNQAGILKVNDNEFNQNYTYINTNFGEGYSFIDVERYREVSDEITFTIYQNISDVLDFKINNITIKSFAEKSISSESLGIPGSEIIFGSNITWHTEIPISSIPNEYTSWVEVEKPNDWVFTRIIDGYEAERLNDCSGIYLGSTLLEIPHTILSPGLWRLEAISHNYISNGSLQVWNNNMYLNESRVTLGDLFRVYLTLNDTVSLPSTQINCSIYYPNASIFWYDSKEPSSHILSFGNFTVGSNMTVGKYTVKVQWMNGQNYSIVDMVGYKEFNFIVWHHTNLTAIDSYIERISGDPCLIKVNYSDFDFNTTISFATITYNSTIGQSGSMAYIGSGIYLLDLDTSGLALGNYYFSFNATKSYYENKTEINLIHLKIVAQPLKLEVPKTTINAIGNSHAICQINVTGALSGTPIWPVNISTNWQASYTVTDHLNGTQTLNFSTNDLPTSGFLENYVITIFANKSNYGSTSELITISINPISTDGSVNITLVNKYLNENFKVKVNYTNQGTGSLISGATCSVTWAGSSSITPVSDEFIINLDTSGLTVDIYNVLIKLEKPAYETIYLTVSVVIQTQEVNLTMSLNSLEVPENTLINLYFNEFINLSVRAFALGEEIYLSGGTITWVSDNYYKVLSEAPATYYNASVVMDAANFSVGINYIYLEFQKENYSTKLFAFQAFVSEQNINLTVMVNSVEIFENTLFNHYFKEKINVSVRAYAEIDKIFLSGGSVTWISDNYVENLLESPSTYFNTSINISAANFSAGINYIYLKFQQANYTTKLFSFQIFVQEQDVNLIVSIDSVQISENVEIDRYFKETINISVRAFAEIEKIYLSGSTITWISEKYEEIIYENPASMYNTSIIIDGANFSAGLNYIFIEFHQANYTTTSFSFILSIRAQTIDVTLKVDSLEIPENFLIERSFNDEIYISCRAYADAEEKYLSGGSMIFINGPQETNLAECGNYWFNLTVFISTSEFNLGVNYVYVKFEQDNYTTTTFSFQIHVSQLNIDTETIGFIDSYEILEGETLNLFIRLAEEGTNLTISGANVTYYWEYGIGKLDEVDVGVYQLEFNLPQGLTGNYRINLIISKEGNLYKVRQTSFFVSISKRELPNYWLWIIIGFLSVISILLILSLRAYVFIPRSRRRQAELLAKTQKFKDMRNIQAILINHRSAGLTLYSKTYNILKGSDPGLFSGFIQALTIVGEEIVNKESNVIEHKIDANSVKDIIEIDFKYFYTIIHDIENLRIVFVLKEPSSERFKKKVRNIGLAINELLGDKLVNFNGTLAPFEKNIPSLLNKNLSLYYKEFFKITENQKLFKKKLSSKDTPKMEKRVLNVISSYMKHNSKFNLESIIEIISEKDENLVIEAIEDLVQEKIITSINR